MDPKHLFADERLGSGCAHCGTLDGLTADHVPSKTFLDEPYAEELPVVPACRECNNGFSSDEEYLACLLECTICGTADPSRVSRTKVKKILTRSPALASRISHSRRSLEGGGMQWVPEGDRVLKVMLKLARGHVVYELSTWRLHDPRVVRIAPLLTLTDEARAAFEAEPRSEGFASWPEIGTRSFMRTLVVSKDCFIEDGWQIVQPGRYRYMVVDEHEVRIVLSEYLACMVIWE